MRIGTWNILSGLTPDAGGPPDFERAIADLDLDVLGLNEVDWRWRRSGFTEQPALAARAMGAHDWRFAPSYAGTYRSRTPTPSALIGPQDPVRGARYGIALLSRIPVQRWHRLDLGASPIGFPLLNARDGKRRWHYVTDEPHQAIAAELANGWTAIATHLSFMTPVALAQLLRVRRWAKRFGSRVVILGDMNITRFLMPLRPHWKSVVDENTYPAWDPVVQFDHILVPHQVQASPLALPPMGISDHRPIAATIEF